MIEVRVPDEQEGTKAVVRAWLRRVGDLVFENEPLVELETDKVTQEVPAPAAGVLSEILLETDAEAVPGALLGRIEPTSARPELRAPVPERYARLGPCLRRGTVRVASLPPSGARSNSAALTRRKSPGLDATGGLLGRMSTGRPPAEHSPLKPSPVPTFRTTGCG